MNFINQNKNHSNQHIFANNVEIWKSGGEEVSDFISSIFHSESCRGS